VISHWPDSLLLGVTATPVRQDGRGLGAMFDRLVLGPSTAELVAAGYLTPVKIYAPPQVADLTGIRTRAGDYANDQAAAAMTRPTVTGDAITHYQRIAAASPRSPSAATSTTPPQSAMPSMPQVSAQPPS
jgi:DNA repair protein RadD